MPSSKSKPWPVRAPGDVFGVTTSLTTPLPKDNFGPKLRISYAVLNQIRNAMTSADLVARYDFSETLRPAATGAGRSSRIALVTDDFLPTIGIAFTLGGLPSTSGLPPIAITDGLWRSAFGADPSVIGRTIWLGTREATITGVLEPRFAGFPPQVFAGVMPIERTSDWLVRSPGLLTDPKQCCINIFGRLRPGQSRRGAAEEIAARANEVHKALGLPVVEVETWGTELASKPGGVRRTIPALFALVFAGCGFVTLLACANIGNLQLARGLRRSREIAVRLSLGASRGRVVRQLLTESAIVAAAGAAGGLLIAWTVPAAIMATDGPSSVAYEPDGLVVAFGMGVAVLATLVSGLAPALRVTRIDWRSGASSLVPGAGTLRGLLLGTQIALSVGLIASASLLSRGALRAAGGADAGFEFHDIDAMYLAVTTSGDSAAEKAVRSAVREAVAAIPGIAIVDAPPWSGISETVSLTVPGRAEPLTAEFSGLNQRALELLRMPLLSGRWHSDDKRLYEATITRSLARALWNDESAIGRTFTKSGEPHPYSVVGLIDEVRLVDTTLRPMAILAPRSTYLPTVLGRHGGEAQLKAVVGAIDPSVRVVSRPLIDGLKKQMQNSFVGVSIASGLGLVALLLASLGVFGVFAYVVEERRREIGLRLALGASRAQVRNSIVATTRRPVAFGLAAGLALALLGGFILRSNLFGLSVLDPLSYLVVMIVLGFAAMAATMIPLRRATRVDPAITLRAD